MQKCHGMIVLRDNKFQESLGTKRNKLRTRELVTLMVQVSFTCNVNPSQFWLCNFLSRIKGLK